jgi:hypothetical protein
MGNLRTMKNISTGTGLLALGLGIAAFPVINRLATPAMAVPPSAAVSAVTGAAAAQATPTVTWRGVTQVNNYTFYHRLWSDGKLEVKAALRNFPSLSGSCTFPAFVCVTGWIQVPGTSNFTGTGDEASAAPCIGDLNGDLNVDGEDLAVVLGNWGGAACGAK